MSGTLALIFLVALVLFLVLTNQPRIAFSISSDSPDVMREEDGAGEPWPGERTWPLTTTGAVVMSSAALRAMVRNLPSCGYMAWIALSGLVVNAIWRKPWGNPVAALALIPLILREG